jgi:hypothetical protein
MSRWMRCQAGACDQKLAKPLTASQSDTEISGWLGGFVDSTAPTGPDQDTTRADANDGWFSQEKIAHMWLTRVSYTPPRQTQIGPARNGPPATSTSMPRGPALPEA